MRINEVDKPVTQADIDQLEIFADRLFAKVGIDVEFTRHFLDRVNDERNIKQITQSELTRLFKQEFKRWGKPIAQMGPDTEAVMKDMATNINMPFALRWDEENQELDLIAKTIMRKADFKTSNQEFAVEDQITEYYPIVAGIFSVASRLLAKRGIKIGIDPIKKAASHMPSGTTPEAIAQTVAAIAAGGKALTKQKNNESVSSVGNKLSIVEGGAMPGVGAIHISEIEPTLAKLEKSLGIDLMNNVLGSVGKRQFSGDIDVALKIEREEIPEFLAKLKSTPDIKDIAQSSVVMTKVQIQDYDGTKTDGRPRTGFVQVDFMPGDPGWLKTYYHSPHENDSKYKGVFRNLLLASICGIYDRQDSAEQIEDGRPQESLRYMWSPTDGLIRVKRTPVRKKSGEGYTKKNSNTIMAGPFKQANEIAQTLGLDSGADLDSFESLLAAIKKNYPPNIVNRITEAFTRNNTVKDIGVPSELA